MQTKYELSVETKRREKAELENLLRTEMLAEEVLKRTELEKVDVLRHQSWAQLPVHNGTCIATLPSSHHPLYCHSH